MNIKDKVKVILNDGLSFTGVITGIHGPEIIVKFNEPEIENRRCKDYDPVGCLTVHISCVRVIP